MENVHSYEHPWTFVHQCFRGEHRKSGESLFSPMRGTRTLTDFEIRQLTDLLSAPFWRRKRALFFLGIRSGLRLTSMLSLRVGEVAIAGEVRSRIRVRRSTMKGRRSGCDIPLHPQAAAALQDHIDHLQDTSANAYVFPGRRSGTCLHRTPCGTVRFQPPCNISLSGRTRWIPQFYRSDSHHFSTVLDCITPSLMQNAAI